ncbi:MAG: exodeoxyribonuclease VII small subunit [Bacteroides sp. 43_108]|nr:MAG: exodeoxyribonuclease VII small subunit [Bacteroides sp. 43_108]
MKKTDKKASEEIQLTYEEAMAKLEEIISGIENGKMNVDSLAENLREAKKLTAFCRARLTGVNDEVNRILAEDEEK